MYADVPVGVALSGGLDSSLICALANQTSESLIRTFSGIAPGFQSDESMFSRLVSVKLESIHTEIDLGSSDFFGAIENFVYAQEAPAATFNPLARYFVLEKASETIKVILDGQGGDELLCGYLRFNKIYNKAFAGNLDEKKKTAKNVNLPLFSELSESFVSSFKPKKPYHPNPDRNTDPVTIAQYQALRGSGLQSLLHTEDRLSMSHSIEGRVPFLDHRLVEFCFSCPLNMKIGDTTKLLIREIAQQKQLLPPQVIARKDKKGFSSPYSEMLHGDTKFKAMFRAFLLDNCVQQKHLFNISNLDLLLDQHIQGEFDNSTLPINLILLFQMKGLMLIFLLIATVIIINHLSVW